MQSLNFRRKWKRVKPCIATDDIVLLRDKNAPRNHWSMGSISSLKISSDDLVRSATVSLAPLREGGNSQTFKRAVSDLVILIPASAS